MKKILFSILAAAAMSAACTQFAEDTIPVYTSVGNPTVSAEVKSDTEITVTVTAGENTNFYGYAVVTGTINATADALVANGYAKNAAVVLQGEAKTPQAAQVAYSEETKSVTLNLTGLVPFTDYTVYAAAVNNMGVVSEVVSTTVKTTDGTEPLVNISGADFQENEDGSLTFAIPFSDPVTLTGTGSAKAYFYGEYYYEESGLLIEYKAVDIPASNMATSGKNLLLMVPATEYIPGAYVSVTYSADIVKNGAGKTNAAFEDHTMGYSAGEVDGNGIYGYYDYASWDFSFVDPSTLPEKPEGDGIEEEEEEELEPILFSNWEDLAMPNYTTSKYPMNSHESYPEISIVYTESSGRTVSYDSNSVFYSQDSKIMYIYLDEAPAYGATISYTIAEETVFDIFGNPNNEFTIEDAYFYSYGYTLDDIVGTYAYKAYSATSSAIEDGSWEIAASDNAEKGNVMFTSMFSTPCTLGNVYATFDVDSGTLSVGSPQVYSNNEKYYFAFTSFNNSGSAQNTPTVFRVSEPGLISSASGFFGDGAFDINTGGYLGYFSVYYDIVATRVTPEEPAPAKASAPARVSLKTGL